MRRLVISFPKSGRTWLRYGLHLAGHGAIAFEHDGFEYNDGACPPLDFEQQPRLDRYHQMDRIVYIERGVHDTIVSLYHQVTGRFGDFFGYKGTVSDFLRDPYFGVVNLIRFQQMWHELSDHLPVLKVRYEDMACDYGGVLREVSNHFELGLKSADCAAITRLANFEAMRLVEQSRSFDAPWLQPRMGHPKVRKGRVGGYVDELQSEDISFIDRELKRLGMPPVE